MIQYVKINPQRLATKRIKPGFFRVQEGVEIAGRTYSSVGNISLLQAEHFATVHVRHDAVVDHINKLNGSETIVIGSQQYTKPGGRGKADVFSIAMKQDHKSKNPTTRWSDIIRLK